MAAVETVSDHTKRSNWQNSFWIPSNPDVQYLLYCGTGTVNGQTYGPPGSGGNTGILVGGQYASTVTGILQVYIDSSGNVQCVSAASTSVSFPAGSLALCFLILDSGGRIQSILDQRTSYLSSAPNLGSGMTESITTPTLRAGFISNYFVPKTSALTPVIPPDVNLPAPGFTLGGGSVNVPGIGVVTSPSIYFAAVAQGFPKLPSGWVTMTAGAVNQIFVSPTTGQVGVQIPPVPGTYPVNSLPICEVTCDATGQIRQISDGRPSYI